MSGMSVKRSCLALDLHDEPTLIETYEQYHQPGSIWPEIPVGIREAGILDMQIYRVGSRLFMIVDYEENTSLEVAFGKMESLPRQPEWKVLMAQFQKKLPEAGPGEQWTPMKPVFLLTDCLP